jgi:HK97 family phage prohead protease
MDPIMLSKNFTAKAETAEDGQAGEFSAIVSAFGNEDSQGDIVEKGAFKATLQEWEDRGRPIPVVWSHQFQDPENFLGYYTQAEETDEGLKLTGLLDLDHPKAARVHQLMKSGLIVEFSISGLVRDYEEIEKDDKDDDEEDFWGWFAPIRIKDIDLWEAGPCFKGANPNTELLSIKSGERSLLDMTSLERIREAMDLNKAILKARQAHLSKEGRVLAQKHVDSLKEAHAKLGDIIAAVEKSPDPEDTGQAGKAVQQAAVLTPKVRALLRLNTIH